MTHQERASRALVVNWPGWIPPAVDFGLILLAFLLGHYARYELQLLRPLDEAFRAPFEPFVAYALIFAAWLTISLQQHNMYRYVRERTWIAECLTIANTGTNALVVVMALSFFLQPLVFSRLLLLYGAIFSMALLSLMRLVYRAMRERQRRRGIGVARVLVVGAGDLGLAVMRNILARPELGFQVIGFVDDDPERNEADIGRLRALGRIDSLAQVLIEERIELVIITLSWESHRAISTVVQECARQEIQVRIVPDLFQLQLNRMQIENLAGIPLLGVKDGVRISRTERLLKRLLDVSVVVLSGPVWGVLFVLTALAIWLEGSGPILYGQERVGKDGHRFKVWKFRSMVQNADALEGPARGGARPRSAPSQGPQRPAPDARGRDHPPHQPGRAAPAHQRPARRHEFGRAASAHPGRSRPVRALASPAAGDHGRADRPVAGLRAQRSAL